METKIYKLICPETNEVKYIGKTTQSLQKRLFAHMSYALRKKHLKGKNEWLRNLYYKDLYPEIIEIDKCEGDLWMEREQYWIDFYSKDYTLFNQTKGGEDFIFKQGNNPWNKGGGKYTKEMLIAMAVAKLGKPLKESTKKKMSEVKKGKKLSDLAIQKSAESNRKKIIEYNLEGNFVKIWNSLTEAANFYNIGRASDIARCCIGKNKTCANRIFKYFEENYPLSIIVDAELRTKEIEVFDKKDKLIQVFKNTIEAAKWAVKLPSNKPAKSENIQAIRGAIRSAIRNNVSYRNYIFKWGKDPKKEN